MDYKEMVDKCILDYPLGRYSKNSCVNTIAHSLGVTDITVMEYWNSKIQEKIEDLEFQKTQDGDFTEEMIDDSIKRYKAMLIDYKELSYPRYLHPKDDPRYIGA